MIGVGLEVLRELVEESVESSDDFCEERMAVSTSTTFCAAAEVFPC